MKASDLEYLKARKAYTPTERLVAERMAALDEIERDRSRLSASRRGWGANGREWLILRNAEGDHDFCINVAEALVDAAHWTEAAAWWKANTAGNPDFPDMEARARTPWSQREPVAVVRGRGMHAPATADDAWAFRIDWPANRSGVAVVGADGIVASPDGIPALKVEML